MSALRCVLAVAATSLLASVSAFEAPLRGTHSGIAASPTLVVGDLRTEHEPAGAYAFGCPPAGVRLEWVVSSAQAVPALRGVGQAAYRVQLSQDFAAHDDPAGGAPSTATTGGPAFGLGGPILWDSGRVESAEPTTTTPSNVTLMYGQPYLWRVQVWPAGAAAAPSAWSGPLAFETEMDPAAWQADDVQWIGGHNQLRTDWPLTAAHSIATARAYVTGLGAFVLYVNGERMGDSTLEPQQSVYSQRVMYLTYDVTDALRAGPGTNNVIAAELGNYKYGYMDLWCNMSTSAPDGYGPDGCRTLRMRIVATLDTGDVMTLVTSAGASGTAQWVVRQGPITYDNLFHGEIRDDRQALAGWNTAPIGTFKAGTWTPAHAMHPAVAAVAMTPQRVRPIRPWANYTAADVAIVNTANGTSYVFDFGQNMNGLTTLRVPSTAADRGRAIRLAYAEVRATDGSVHNTYWPCGRQPYGGNCANQTDLFTMAGTGGTEVFVPTFSVHGFRFVQVWGLPAAPVFAGPEASQTLVAHFLSNDFVDVGAASLPVVSAEGHGTPDILNSIHHITTHAQRSQSFGGIFTDCPQRERRGWMGDAHMSSNEAMLNFDTRVQHASFLDSIRDEQLLGCAKASPHQPCNGAANGTGDAGSVPDVSPYEGHPYGSFPGSAVWASAYPVIAYNMWRNHADAAVLARHYDGLKALMAFFKSRTDAKTGLLLTGGLGDWNPPGGNGAQLTPADSVSAFYYCYDLWAMATIATVLGHAEDAEAFMRDYNASLPAYHAHYWDEKAGCYSSQHCSQTSQLMPLYLGVPPDAKTKAAAMNTLLNDIKTRGYTTTSGIVGLTFVFDTLRDVCGRGDVALRMLMQDTYPSFGQMVRYNATTLWEAFRGDFYNVFGSRNHIMYGGGVGVWSYTALAGIDTVTTAAQAAWRRVRVRPLPHAMLLANASVGHPVTASGSVATRLGLAEVRWAYWGQPNADLSLNLTVPAGATAEVHVPALGAHGAGAQGVQVTEHGVPIWRNGGFVSGTPGVTSAAAGSEGAIPTVVFEVQGGGAPFVFAAIMNP